MRTLTPCRLFAVMLLVSTCGQSLADDITVQAQQPWKKHMEDGRAAYTLNVSTSGWPSLKATIDTKPDTFYLLKWKMKATDFDNSKVNFQLSITPEGGGNYSYLYILSPEWSRYAAYFNAQDAARVTLRFFIDPVKEMQVQVKDLEIQEVSKEQLSTNLLIDWNFEESDSLPVSWRRALGSKAFTASVVPSKDFISGEKSMMIDLSAGGGAVIGVNSIYLPVELGRKVTLKFWAKAESDIVMSASIQGWGPRHTGEHFYKEEKFKLENAWKEYHLTAKIPEDVGKYPDLQLKIAFICFRVEKAQEGKIYFDDVSYVID